MRVIGEDGVDKVAAMKKNYKTMGLDCLVILGGNGTHKTANLLSEEGLNIITLPKTIDNDLWGTDITFGFYSALDVATDVIDRLHTTATSHGRILVVEIMGHKAGWLNLYAGVAGGADVVLIPEIPYSIDKITEVIDKRTKDGKVFSIVAVAEGAISLEESKMSKKEFKAARANMPYSSIAYRVADDIEKATGHEVRVAVPGHIQRGGAPSAYDRVLSTRLGTKAAELIKNEKYGVMVGVKNDEVVPVPLKEVAGKLKSVPLDNEVIASARSIGVSFGD
jgi:6-phosphofructokinase 1